jgi:hypothetical protein
MEAKKKLRQLSQYIVIRLQAEQLVGFLAVQEFSLRYNVQTSSGTYVFSCLLSVAFLFSRL